ELEKAMSVAVGFGISKPEHVRSVIDAGADAAIVGSAFVRLIEDNVHDEEKMLRSVEEFARALKDAACGGVRRAT
ncbi:MAG: Tryptophan synthase alpha chain, partial [Candidatus Alkanophagales archaeon MCA70_species_2]|nr:Tryptophan synthase alpha chain [Candidatus Alkanophaga liquidiphilum]